MSFWGREAASWQQLCQPLGALDEGASVGRCRAPAVLPELGKESFHWKYSTMGGILAQNPWFSFMRTAVNFCREHQHLESNFPEINPFWQVLFVSIFSNSSSDYSDFWKTLSVFIPTWAPALQLDQTFLFLPCVKFMGGLRRAVQFMEQ